ncbi:DUF2510 domain-containing protein [Naumannella halotolerans]|uniref:DUF2510 domain-containing protein n=1 Tax=Naumannella halotolerans TaxID=993414 RepID=UPI00370D76E2
MSTPGWYSDPGGQPGMYRYWDGQQWSTALSPVPTAAPPGAAVPPGQLPAAGAGARSGGQGAPGTAQGGYGPAAAPATRRGGAGWWILAAVLAIGLIIGAVIVLPRLLTGRELIDPADPGPNATPQSLCPPYPSELPTAPPAVTDGRVRAGNLSYPELGAPWSAPIYDNRVPFGRDTATQVIITEQRDGGDVWQAGVLIAELAAGDGFFSPEQGSEIVTECIVGSFYGDAEVTRDDQRNEAITIDGHEGWIVESELGFDLPDVEATSELMIVVIVRTTDVTSALYFASIPGNTPEYEQPARKLVDELRVDD